MSRQKLKLGAKPPPILFSSAATPSSAQQTSALTKLRSAASTVGKLYKQVKPLIDRATKGKKLTAKTAEKLTANEQQYEGALTTFLGALQGAVEISDRLRSKPQAQQSFVQRASAAAQPAIDMLSTGCSLMSGLAWIPLVPEPWGSRLDLGRDVCRGLERAVKAVQSMLG